MTKSQVEVITSVERRRRWSAAEKERIVAASLEPGAVVSALAREAGIHPSQLYGWRRQLCARRGSSADFAAVRIVPELAPQAGLAAVASGVIEVEFASGTRLRIAGAADPATVSALIGALTAGRRRR
jgi:transposase